MTKRKAVLRDAVVRRAWERLALWIVAFIVAAFLPVTASSARFSWQLYNIATQVNQAGYFRDLYFVAVVLAVVSMTNLADNLFRNYSQIHLFSQMMAVLAMVIYFTFIMFGISHYKDLSHGSISESTFNVDCSIILGILSLGSFIEIIIAYEGVMIEEMAD